jgi:hypothetical protein
MAEESPERRLTEFIGKFSPEVARTARSARTKVRRLLPDAFELVYDNYNALAIAFGPTEKASDIILSIALYPRWVSLFFARGVSLPDPSQVLRGSGNQMRHVVLEPVSLLDTPAVRALIMAAVATHPKPLAGVRGRTIIKSVSAKQRPRRTSEERGAQQGDELTNAHAGQRHGRGHRYGAYPRC